MPFVTVGIMLREVPAAYDSTMVATNATAHEIDAIFATQDQIARSFSLSSVTHMDKIAFEGLGFKRTLYNA